MIRCLVIDCDVRANRAEMCRFRFEFTFLYKVAESQSKCTGVLLCTFDLETAVLHVKNVNYMYVEENARSRGQKCNCVHNRRSRVSFRRIDVS